MSNSDRPNISSVVRELEREVSELLSARTDHSKLSSQHRDLLALAAAAEHGPPVNRDAVLNAQGRYRIKAG